MSVSKTHSVKHADELVTHRAVLCVDVLETAGEVAEDDLLRDVEVRDAGPRRLYASGSRKIAGPGGMRKISGMSKNAMGAAPASPRDVKDWMPRGS